jgi:glycosyltransferase involved in cell wall biosynthesis
MPDRLQTCGHSPAAHATPRGRLRILSLACVYPNPREPGYGAFVRARLQAMARLADVKVIAPVPVLDYARLFDGKRIPVPAARLDGAVEILHPRWLYPPLGGAANAALLPAQLLRLVSRLRRRYAFDLLDAHFAFPDGIAAAMLAAALGCDFSVTLRGNETMHARSAGCRRLMSWALRRAARVIAVSGPLHDFALSIGADPSRVRTIPNGVDADVFYPRNRNDCRRKHAIPLHAPVIVSAGSLIERKGHHRVVAALRALGGPESGIQLLVAGGPGREGSFESKLRQMVVDYRLGGAVRFLGEIPPQQLAEVMSAADVVCLASSREGWPNVVQEALSCGTPVVATRVGAVPEMLCSEEYGFHVPPHDPPALETALRLALSRRWDHDAISRWGHRRSWQHVAREVVSEFEALRA